MSTSTDKLNQIHAAAKTDTQLAAWIATFKSVGPKSPNYPMLQACIAEEKRRNQE
jgi:hypothetical protein